MKRRIAWSDICRGWVYTWPLHSAVVFALASSTLVVLTRCVAPRAQDICRNIHYLATIRNKLVHEYGFNSIPVRCLAALASRARCSCAEALATATSVLWVFYSVQDRPVFINKFVASEAQLRVILSKQAGGGGKQSNDICRMQ